MITNQFGAPTHRFRRNAGAGGSGRRLAVAIVGYGYWGPNLVRNVVERPEFELRALCECDASRARAFSMRVPGVPVVADFGRIVDDDAIEAVIVATPPHTHHALVKQALEAGKHVLVEKPLATRSADARDLLDTAAAHDVLLMPGHTFLYSPPVRKVRELIDTEVLGEMYFVTSSRMNLGKYQRDGVILDLAPHDISILLHLLQEPVVKVAASARSVFHPTVPETAFLTMTFASGTAANVELSWLAPRKIRQMVIVGSRRMVQYDDTAGDEAIRIYDRGMELEFDTPETFGEYQLTYRSGDIIAPRLEAAEPLALELQDFAHCVRSGDAPCSHGELGYEVVRTMEAAEESLRLGGEPVALADERARAAA